VVISFLGVFRLEAFFHFQFHVLPVVQCHLGGAGTRGAGGVDRLTNALLALRPGTLSSVRVIAVVALALGFLNCFHFTKYLFVI